jgi:hypothetical protein
MHRPALRSVQSTLVLLSFLVSPIPSSADSSDHIVKQLCGTRAREWVFKRLDSFLGPGNKCTQGETYRFSIKHDVTITTCVNGEIHTETKQWSIDTADPLDTHITVGDISYILLFEDSSQGHFMILRTKSTIKTHPTVDKRFQLGAE